LEIAQEKPEGFDTGYEMGYSSKSIRNSLSKINEKLRSANRIQALEVAIDMGLFAWRMGFEENYKCPKMI
jgi:hypothetical protein